MYIFYFSDPKTFVKSSFLFKLIVIIITINVRVTGANVQPKEKISVLINKLRNAMLPRIPPSSYLLTYVSHDLYLLRWLQANSYNLEAAEKQMINHLDWRTKERIDTIDEEDWSEFQQDYPIFVDTVDRIGNPVGESWFSDWEVRRAVVSGQKERLNRWVTRLAEIQSRRLYEIRAEGNGNATYSLLLWDLEGFNLLVHGCPACVSVYINMCNVYEAHYPGLWGGIMLTNMNQAFNSILTTMLPFLRPATRQIMHSFYSKKQWQGSLDRLIERGQRSVRFGGTIKREGWRD